MDKTPAPKVPAQRDTTEDQHPTHMVHGETSGSLAKRLAQAQHRTEHVRNLRRLGDPAAFEPADLDNPAKFEPMDVDTLPHYKGADAINPPSPDRVTALVGMDDAGTDRLIADLTAACPDAASAVAAELAARIGSIAQTLGDYADQQDATNPDQVIDLDTATTVLPNHHTLHDAAARLRLATGDLRTLAVRILAAGLAVLVCGGLAVSTAPKAEAAAYPLAATPLRVIVAGPTTTVALPVVATRTTDGRHYIAALTTSTGQTITATGTSPLLAISGPAWTPGLRLGAQTWALTDRGDHTTRNIPVTVLRQSRVSAPAITPLPGYALIAGIVSHYEPKTNSYAGDQASPVQIQNLQNGIWRTIATVTTSPTVYGPGSVQAIVPALPGRQTYRLARPAGTTVTGGVGQPVTTTIPDLLPARGI